MYRFRNKAISFQYERCSVPNVNVPNYELRWIPEAVRNVLHQYGIEDRNTLARTLGVGRTTIDRAFDENWSGAASAKVLAQFTGVFRVPMSRVVVEPGLRHRDVPKTARKRAAA